MRFFIIIISVLMLVGCTDKRVIEEIGFIHGMALDIVNKEQYEEGRRLLVTVSIPQIMPDAENNREVLSTVATSDKDAMLSISRQSNRNLVGGQLRNVLYGESLARSGIEESIQTLNRDPSFGSRTKVSVVNGVAGELLRADFKQHPRTGRYIEELLEKETRNNMIPQTRLYQFTRDLYEDGIDPVTPVINLGTEEIVVDGIALFKDDQYVEKIDPKEARIFFFLRGDFSEGALHFDIEDEKLDRKAQLMFASIENRRTVDVLNSDIDNIEVLIKIQARGSLLEYNGTMDISNKEDQKKLERQIEKQIETKATEMLKKMQELQVDSVGIGKYVRNSMGYEQWKGLNWRETYPNIHISVEANIKIKDIGFFK